MAKISTHEIMRSIVCLENSETKGRGLGVICGNQILTCAHLLIGSKDPHQDSFAIFNAFRPNVDKRIFQVITYNADICLDFMTLGWSTLSGITPAPGIEPNNPFTDEKWPVPHILHMLGEPKWYKFEGYFFDTPGTNKIRCEISCNAFSPMILLDCPSQRGCSGGPIFTKANQLIGILTNQHGDETQGVRIDLVAPNLVLNAFDDLPTLRIQ